MWAWRWTHIQRLLVDYRSTSIRLADHPISWLYPKRYHLNIFFSNFFIYISLYLEKGVGMGIGTHWKGTKITAFSREKVPSKTTGSEATRSRTGRLYSKCLHARWHRHWSRLVSLRGALRYETKKKSILGTLSSRKTRQSTFLEFFCFFFVCVCVFCSHMTSQNNHWERNTSSNWKGQIQWDGGCHSACFCHMEEKKKKNSNKYLNTQK